LHCDIEVDGNVNERTIPEVVEAGARVLIGGSSGLFRPERNLQESLRVIRETALRGMGKG
jgi:ribulose-phosphate 3-epimerase